MRQPGGNIPLVDLSQRMKHALSEEQAEPVSSWAGNRWLKPASGLAIAASVALMAIVAVGPGQQQVTDPASATAQPFTSPNILPAVPRTQAVSFSPDAQDTRLNSYLLRHNQSIGSMSSQGFLGYVTIISAAESENASSEDDAVTDEERAAAE